MNCSNCNTQLGTPVPANCPSCGHPVVLLPPVTMVIPRMTGTVSMAGQGNGNPPANPPVVPAHVHPRPRWTIFGLLGFIGACVALVLLAVFVPILWHNNSVNEDAITAQGAALTVTNGVVNGHTATLATHDAALVAHEGKINALDTTVTTLTSTVGTQGSTLSSLSGTVGTLGADLATVKGNLATTMRAVQAHDTAITDLGKRMDKAEKNIGGLWTRQTDLRAAAKLAAERGETTAQAVEKLRIQFGDMRGAVDFVPTLERIPTPSQP
jgi:hypothetical protein